MSERERLAKKWGRANDFKGAPGGWIYNATGRPVAQGWLALFNRYKDRILAEPVKTTRQALAGVKK